MVRRVGPRSSRERRQHSGGWGGGQSGWLSAKLTLLDAADALEDLRIAPGNRLERLRGDREGQHSIRVNDQWRICFLWQQGDAYRVELVDYH